MTRKTDDPNLEDMIRAAAANGELTYLSICPVAGKGPGNIVFSATYSPASKWGHGFASHADPVMAVKLAMQDERFGKLVTQMHDVIKGGKPKFSAKDAPKPAVPEEVDDSDFI